MSDPIDTTKVRKYDAIQNALCELVSAESSCNMQPDPISLYDYNAEHGELGRERYISESDANVKHALEHMHAAFRLMNMAHHDQEALKTQVYKLVVQLKEAGIEPRVKTWLDESQCLHCAADIDIDRLLCKSCEDKLDPADRGTP